MLFEKYGIRADLCHLDEKIMQAAASQFVGTHDFAAVRSVGTDVKSTVRTVYYYDVERQGNLIYLRVCANGFLYNMARAMAGTVVYAAEGKIKPSEIGAILDSGNRTAAGPTVPPGGLYMTHLWYDDGVENFESHLTTPEPLELHKHFDNAVKSQTDFFTMEVSSQALKYGRTEGVHFKIGCYLNIGIDHISAVEHPDFEDYFTSKMKLFTQCDTAIINLDSDLSERVVEYSKNAKRVITFSTKNPQADVYGFNIHKDNSETVFSVKTDAFESEFRLSMPGLFNVENALCAIGVAYVIGISPEYICNGLYKAKTAGRMEIYESEDKKIAVIVDYAHNKLSFETIISSRKTEYVGRPVSILFGCPGNKALIRRKDMGEVSGKMADFIYVTEDDPAEEKIDVKEVEITEDLGFELNGKDFEKVVLMFGDNECGWSSYDSFVVKYSKVIAAVKERLPKAEIYLHAVLPGTVAADHILRNGVDVYAPLLRGHDPYGFPDRRRQFHENHLVFGFVHFSYLPQLR